ncbi:MAG: 2,5-dioxovalerate dehydrogenase [Tardiphaga sp.]|nr:2,5-dioxovalerate dehydrogenase [Tardiphaga sp.]
MMYVPHGKHLIAGEWVKGSATFQSEPARGVAQSVSAGTSEHVKAACDAAEEAFWSFGYSEREHRAKFLNAIADEIEARGDVITRVGSDETGLPEARLAGERSRTVTQLQLFARHILSGEYLDRRHDQALPDRLPAPRPDLRLIQRPIGPVAVFGASNFPLAFSTAGGDTAAAFAAGCPVVVKGHAAHPGTSEIVADAIDAARRKLDLHPGVFSLIQGHTPEVGAALVQNPNIKAVGFTGSLAGGRTLFDLCAARPEPIPFFGELGSINPMFVLPAALRSRGDVLGEGWANSLVLGAGQFCTNPGVAIVIDGPGVDAFVASARKALAATAPQVMLSNAIAKSFREGCNRVAAIPGVQQLLDTSCDDRTAGPVLFEANAKSWLSDSTLHEEVFGPLGILIKARDTDQALEIARSLEGQLTATLQMDAEDNEIARALFTIIERKVGRVLANGFPTGVEVSDAMVHGGPYPASTNFGATSVGTLSIRRFVRPVSYQNIPDDLLPSDIR